MPIEMTSERIDPGLVDESSELDKASLELHLERYRWAGKFTQGACVVDAACGTGYGSDLLFHGGAKRVHGVDISAEAIEFAQRTYAQDSVTFEENDILRFELPFPVDVWVSLETIEHLPDPKTYLRRIRAALPIEGRLIASVPITFSTDANPYHLWDFSERTFTRMLDETGFVIEERFTQTQPYRLGEVVGGGRAKRQQSLRANLPAYYLQHPGSLVRRLWSVLSDGFCNKYLVVCARVKTCDGMK